MMSVLGRIWAWIKRRIQKKEVVEMVTNISGDVSLAVQNVKEKYLASQDKFELLRSEVICCARQIKIWLAISQAKEKFKRLRYESFLRWTQIYSSLRPITVDGFKISQESNKYIKSVLGDILSLDQYKNLIKHSRLQARINYLKIIMEPLDKWRNKRYAHLDNEEVAIVTCNLQDLFFALANLDNSLNYISHFLLNPRRIFNNEWESYKTPDANDKESLCYLESYFENDPTLQEFSAMLQELNEKELVSA